MLHSAASSKPVFNTFQLFMHQILNGDNAYKKAVDNVLSEARLLSLGEKNIYTVDRSFFSLIYHLSTNFNDFLEKIDTQNIKNEDYKYLLEKMQNENELMPL